jgi:hypothetical protein
MKPVSDLHANGLYTIHFEAWFLKCYVQNLVQISPTSRATWFAVRGAARRGGSRIQAIDADRVRALAQALARPGAAAL